jgi:hypothetical protein
MEQSEKALRALIVCYDKEDKVYKDRVVELLGEENTLTPTYKEGDLKDPQTFLKDFKEVIKDTQATIVLIGNNTWKRKLVDWEIYASMLDTPEKKRNGIIALSCLSAAIINTGLSTVIRFRLGSMTITPTAM